MVGQTALRSFDLKTGAAKGTYPFPTNGGVCNDMAVAADGTVYATESFNNRIHRLSPVQRTRCMAHRSAIRRHRWRCDARRRRSLREYLFRRRDLRIPVNPDGSAGTMEKIETSMPLTRPDGLRTVGPQTLIQAEGGGRLAELTIKDNRADVRVLREGLTGATGVTVVGDTALVLVERAKAVAAVSPE